MILSKPEYVPWTELPRTLYELQDAADLRLDTEAGLFVGHDADEKMDVTITPPLAVPIGETHTTVDDYLTDFPTSLGIQLVFIMQAGACSMGVWDDDDLLTHKVIKKYVVRGKGRAQPGYLKTKGKSRYGSRLRLRNARALLEEINERFTAWSDEHGPFDRIFVSSPVRMLAELYMAKPEPPFDKDALVKIPLDLKVTHDDLRRARRALVHGKVVWSTTAPSDGTDAGE